MRGERRCPYRHAGWFGVVLLFSIVCLPVWRQEELKPSISGLDYKKAPATKSYEIPATALFDAPWYESAGIDTTKEFCVEWHIDTDEWWTHQPDWIVTGENDTHYCLGPILDNPEKAQFFRDLYRNQFQNDCSRTHTRMMINQGWGSDLHGVFEGLAYGLELQRPIQFWLSYGPWIYTVGPQATINGTRRFINGQVGQQKPACRSFNMECYFLPLSNCVPGGPYEETGIPENYYFNTPVAGWFLEYATRAKTVLRHRIFRYLADRRTAPAIVTPCTILHVRRADVVLNQEVSHDIRRYYPIADYINNANVAIPGALHHNILLLTDDHNAIAEAEDQFPQYHWMYLNRTRHRGAEGGFENQIPSGDPVQEVVSLLAELDMARRCTSLVHTSSSFSNYLWAMLLNVHGVNKLAKLAIDNDQERWNAFAAANNNGSPNGVSRDDKKNIRRRKRQRKRRKRMSGG
jgi:hypothetical protein